MMFEFSITEVHDKLVGLSIKEKITELQALSNDLSDASLEVFRVKCELEKEYKEQIEKPLEHSITLLRFELHFEDILQIREGLCGRTIYEVVFEGHTYYLYLEVLGINWFLLVTVKEKKARICYDLLEKFANRCGLPYKCQKGNRSIELSIEESKIFEQIKRILSKIK